MSSGKQQETKQDNKAAKAAKPPAHLSKAMKEFWRGVFERKKLQPHHVLILLRACEAFDRTEQARRILKKERVSRILIDSTSRTAAGSGDRAR